MISDVLADAIDDLDYHLSNPAYVGTYQGRTRKQIAKLRDEMAYMVHVLDAPPGVRLPRKAKLLAQIAEQRGPVGN